MRKLRCLVVDDEELARTLLDNYIGRLPHLELAGKCKDPFEAASALREEPTDILFLDIQMPGLTGIEFLRTLQKKPLVIFTTAYADYALEGYTLDAADYLLKPFSFERFLQAVNKAAELLRLREGEAATGNVTGEAVADKGYLLVKSEHKVHRLKYEDILYIESMREYVAYHTPQGRILSLSSLKSLEEDLPADRFIRIHKSYIVAIDKIATLEGNLLHVGTARLPIGANYREGVMERVFQ
jgi:DNA-binding LytR/AlgR family response regulator